MRVELGRVQGFIIYVNAHPVTGVITDYEVIGLLSKRIRVRFIDPADAKRDQYSKTHNTARVITSIPRMVLEAESIRHPSGKGFLQVITKPEYVIEGL